MSVSDKLAASLPVLFGRYVNKRLLSKSNRQRRYEHRLYDFRQMCMEIGKECLRWYDGRVYAHDGKIWVPVSDVVLESSISSAFVKSGADKGDIVKCSLKLVQSLKGGASESPLHVSPSIVGFRNGVWDFRDIDKPVRHSFSDMLPVVTLMDYDYDSDATCPMWTGFLKSVLPSQDIDTLQKYLGLGCVDRSLMSNKVEETLWLVGGGGNGKSTIADVVMGVYGTENVSGMSLGNLITGSSDVRARFLGSIVGKIFNFCTEVQAADISRYEGAFKSLCSGEPQTVRRIGGDVETAYDIPFMIFNMNRKPTNSMLDRAMLRRLVFITFKASVTQKDMNRELGNMLKKEYSGIRNWMIEGYRRLVRSGFKFTRTELSDDEKRQYMIENHQTVRLFMDDEGLRENYRVGNLDEKPKMVVSNILYQKYVEWCEAQGCEHEEFNRFGRLMTQYGVEKKKTSVGVVYYLFSDVDKVYMFH